MREWLRRRLRVRKCLSMRLRVRECQRRRLNLSCGQAAISTASSSEVVPQGSTVERVAVGFIVRAISNPTGLDWILDHGRVEVLFASNEDIGVAFIYQAERNDEYVIFDIVT